MSKPIGFKLRAGGTNKGVSASTLSIAEALLRTTNLTQRVAARMRLNALIAKRVEEGCDAAKVIAGVKAAMTRIGRRKGVRQTSRAWMPETNCSDSQ